MTKPITLSIPIYYDKTVFRKNAVKFIKSTPLLKGDTNEALYIASIENLEGYTCNAKEIPEEYLAIATRCFKRDIEENWALHDKINGCKVYTYNWDAKTCHFRLYWIVISKKHVLQLVGIFQPENSQFYKHNFMYRALETTIATDHNYNSDTKPENLFEVLKVPFEINDLKEILLEQKKKDEKIQFLKENLKITKPQFYKILKAELKEKEEVSIDAFMCLDWNMYYDLHNPENFSNPDSSERWEDNSDVFEYYKKPFTDNSKVVISSYSDDFSVSLLKKLIQNKEIVELNVLQFFEKYTFGNGGAYAEAIHYKYAKIEIERLHNTNYTNQEFLKRNLCLNTIAICKKANEIRLHFACSWDTEHGIEIIINKNYTCSTD